MKWLNKNRLRVLSVGALTLAFWIFWIAAGLPPIHRIGFSYLIRVAFVISYLGTGLAFYQTPSERQTAFDWIVPVLSATGIAVLTIACCLSSRLPLETWGPEGPQLPTHKQAAKTIPW